MISVERQSLLLGESAKFNTALAIDPLQWVGPQWWLCIMTVGSTTCSYSKGFSHIQLPTLAGDEAKKNYKEKLATHGELDSNEAASG